MYKKLLNKVAHRRLAFAREIGLLLILNTALIMGVFLLKDSLPPVVPLFYGLPKGADQLAPNFALSLPPLVAIIVTLVCLTFISILKDSLTKRILLTTSAIATILSFVTVTRIILLIHSF